jgi:thiol-disulfide isomerase/thioredoxin
MRLMVGTAVAFLFLIGIGCAVNGAGKSGSGSASRTTSEEKISLPLFKLQTPRLDTDKKYLGLTGGGAFKFTEIKAEVLIMEVLSMYCPHCQKGAPMVNELYRTIEDRPDLRGRVKLIGIARKNSPFEMGVFRERYKIPFPLFSDGDGSISKALGVYGTPTFIGVKINKNGSYEGLLFKAGRLKNVNDFLEELLGRAGIRKEG